MLDVIGIGSSVYDTLMMVPTYPKEDTKLQGIQTLVQGGGPCATALVALSKLGISAGYMGTIGNDAFGQFMLKDLAKYGVSTKHVQPVDNSISFHGVIWLSQDSSSRTCVWNPGTVPPPKAQDLEEEVIRGAKVLHLDGHMLEAALWGANIAKEAGVKVSYDAGGTYPGVERLLPYVDFFIPSEEYALAVSGKSTGEEAAKALYDQYKPEVLVVTQGAKGGIIYEKGNASRYPAFPVEVVDTNGAGDTFHGAFVAGYLKGMSFYDCAIYASAVSALKCTVLGAREGIPSDEKARAFLREQGIVL